jgi:DNA polymerase-3 subunit epsilon
MAPTFEELARWLEQIVNGRTLVAHNSQFDSNFLSRELKRAGIQLISSQLICTQRLAAGMSLKDACASLDIDIEHHHSALADARASFAIFKHFFSEGNVTLEASPNFSSAFRGTSAVTVSRSQVGIPSFARPVSSFSRPIVFPDLDSHFAYWAVLNEYLEDLEISKFEREALRGLAESLGLSAGQEHSLQVDYLNSLEAASLRDGIVSQTEADALNIFAKALGIPKTFVPHDNSTGLPESGALICVTGTAEIEGKNWNKDSWRTKLSEMGYRFTDDLKKSDNVAMLLQDSPGSQSSKVAKAMAWGIPRMSFAEFLKLTGDNK